MSFVIVGSVAFDTIRTPWGSRERIVGGSGTYCSLAASYFTRPRIVGVVGRDFPRKTRALLKSRGIDLEGLKIKAGKTFHWEGKYEAVPISSKDEIADLTHAFNLMSDKLRKLDEMRMELMSEISHEMRTPLQVIKAGCYSIIHAKDSGPLTQRQRDAVGMIHQATNRINSFITCKKFWADAQARGAEIINTKVESGEWRRALEAQPRLAPLCDGRYQSEGGLAGAQPPHDGAVFWGG
jgi:hypothetical protein